MDLVLLLMDLSAWLHLKGRFNWALQAMHVVIFSNSRTRMILHVRFDSRVL